MSTDASLNDSQSTLSAESGSARSERAQTIVIGAARGLIALLFLLAGAAKILGPAPFLEHMTRFSVPGRLLPAVIAVELGAGVCLLVGWRVRWAAGALAIFCMMTAMIFHHQLGISAERTSFFKDLAIAGGLLCIAASARTTTSIREPENIDGASTS